MNAYSMCGNASAPTTIQFEASRISPDRIAYDSLSTTDSTIFSYIYFFCINQINYY